MKNNIESHLKLYDAKKKKNPMPDNDTNRVARVLNKYHHPPT